MPWLDHVQKCPSCGNAHELCHPEIGVPLAGTVYSYDCPDTGRTVDKRDCFLKKTSDVVPNDAVRLSGPVLC